MSSNVFKASPDYIEDHTEVQEHLNEMWVDYTAKRKLYVKSFLSINFTNRGMNNAEELMESGNDEVRAAKAEFDGATEALHAAHVEYKASMSSLIQGHRL